MKALLKNSPFLSHIICVTESVHFNVFAPPHNKNWKQQWLKAAGFFYKISFTCFLSPVGAKLEKTKKLKKVKFLFSLLCDASKGFMKAFIKPFEAPQRSVKIKI